MASNTFIPDFIVAIDFGMTCTAVAWSMAPSWPDARYINVWPKRHGGQKGALNYKVDSKISYDAEGNITAWGLQCSHEDDYFVADWFKVHLNPNHPSDPDDSKSHQRARKLFRDYMRCLHNHLQARLHESIAHWSRKQVEYVFSIPTKWSESPSIAADLEDLIREAGFGASGPRCHISMHLSEAEAAAVAAAGEQFQPGDVVLVCDAGGATTDVSILKIVSCHPDLKVRALTTADGCAAGSALIDMDMEEIVEARLEQLKLKHNLRLDVHRIAHTMVAGDFQDYKHSFGVDDVFTPRLELRVPGSVGRSHGTHVSIKCEKLKHIFDRQISTICETIDSCLADLHERHRVEQVTHFVLSGGLSNSPYIIGRLKARYLNGPPSPNASRMRYVHLMEPQMAVVRGLVWNCINVIRRGSGVVHGRSLAVSYGVLYRERYDSSKHVNARVIKDESDGKNWAEDQIHWIIKKGEPFPETGVRHEYQLQIEVGDDGYPKEKKWEAQIYMSNLPERQLPRYITDDTNEADVRRVCCVKTTFTNRHFKAAKRAKQSQGDFRVINPTWPWQRGKPHVYMDFLLNVVAGSVSLDFSLESKYNRPGFNKNYTQLEVAWEECAFVRTHNTRRPARSSERTRSASASRRSTSASQRRQRRRPIT